MNIPFLGAAIDERFLEHRRRSTSLAGIIGGTVAVGLFAYHFYVDHVWSWDLFTVAITIVVVKVTMLVWYRLTD
jgi:hypothetical protein